MFKEFTNPESVDYDIKTAVNKETVTIKKSVNQKEKYIREIINMVGFLEDGEWVNYGITEDEYLNPTIEVVNKIKNKVKQEEKNNIK